MASCRNPECVNGRTPGVIASGKGTANQPIVGASMRWGWVNCRACNPSDVDRKRGVTYMHVHRTGEEIAERAELANSRARYEPVSQQLQKIHAKTPVAAPAPTVGSDQVGKLLEQVSKLVDQVTELSRENRELRQKLDFADVKVVKVRRKNHTVKPS